MLTVKLSIGCGQFWLPSVVLSMMILELALIWANRLKYGQGANSISQIVLMPKDVQQGDRGIGRQIHFK